MFLDELRKGEENTAEKMLLVGSPGPVVDLFS